jgi:CIC family chloride channel protein
MGAVVAGATLAPLTGVLMMFELTGSYQIVLPLLVACGVAAAVVQGKIGGSIYTLGARKRGLRLSRGGPSLRDLSVAQAVDRVEALPARMSFEELRALVGPTQHAAFPVVSDGALIGVIPVREARKALLDPDVDQRATARTFARAAVTLLPDDDLGTATERLSTVAEGVVVDEQQKVIGVITRDGILQAWQRATGEE